MKFANVIVDISLEKLDKTFQYRIPPELSEVLRPGMPVRVPFGRRQLQGYVTELTDQPEFDVEKMDDESLGIINEYATYKNLLSMSMNDTKSQLMNDNNYNGMVCRVIDEKGKVIKEEKNESSNENDYTVENNIKDNNNVETNNFPSFWMGRRPVLFYKL